MGLPELLGLGDAARPPLTSHPTVLMLVAAVLLYGASRVAAGVLAGRHAGRGVRPGRLALGHWLPIAAVALVAVAMRRPDVAVGVVFAAAVGCLALAAGVVTYLAPVDSLPPSRRAWQFVLPAALLPLVAGFAGSLSWMHALMMLGLGAAILAVWLDRSVPQPVLAALVPLAAVDSPAAGEDLEDPIAAPGAGGRRGSLAVVYLVLAVVLAGVGAWAAVRATVRTGETAWLVPAAAVPAVVVSPLLTLPILGTGSVLAQRGQSASMLTTLAAIALLNLCGLLPAVVLCGYMLPGVSEYIAPTPPPPPLPPAGVESVAPEPGGDVPAEVTPLLPTSAPSATEPAETQPAETQPATTQSAPTTAAATQPARRPEKPEPPPTLWGSIREHAGPTPYPLAAWRVDTVVLVVLGLAMIPISLGRWSLTRMESAGLIVGYAAYLVLVTALGARVV